MPGPGAPEPNQLLAQQQAMRAIGLERAKKTSPDKHHDKKYIFITLGVLAGIIAILFAIAFFGEEVRSGMKWLLELL